MTFLPVLLLSLATLDPAFDALGGRAAVTKAAVVEFTASGTYFAREQASDPANEIAEAERRYRYVIDVAHRRMRREAELLYPGGIRFSTLAVTANDGGFQVDLLKWRQGTDLRTFDAKESASAWSAAARLLPHLALLQALESADVRMSSANGGTQVEYTAADGTLVTLQLDAQSRPVRIVAKPVAGPSTETAFSDFEPHDSVLIPRNMTVHVAGRKQEDVRLTNVAIRAAAADAEFRVPAGYTPPPHAEPRAQRVAEGLYFLDGMPGGYHAMFIDGGESVTMIEAPLSADFAEKALAVIARTLPDKPVRRVIVTHHHGDHIGGLARLLAEGATIVAAAGSEAAIRRQLPADVAAKASIDSVRKRTLFGRGAARFEVLPIESSHVAPALMVFFPSARALFQGDLVYVPERGPVPPAFPVTVEFQRILRLHRLAPKMIYGVHGRPGTAAEMRVSLRAR